MMETPGTTELIVEVVAEADREVAADRLFAAVAATLAPRTPRATYRIQLNKGFAFDDARAVLDYLDALGISDLYVSPPLAARPNSMHGYDVTDHTRLNPELGGAAGFERLTDRLYARHMGLLVDTVPNHMGIGGAGNPWWMDVLENGPCSLYSNYFDIDWHPLKSELSNKVLLPVLGDHYGRVLDRGELKVRYEDGAFFVGYWDWTLPINPRTYRAVLEPLVPALMEELGEEHDAVLELQSIVTGLGHLPSRSETRRARIIERHREKEILKKRLAVLVSEHAAVGRMLGEQLTRLNGTADAPRSFDGLDALLESQAYRLSYFRVAAEEINYRRFFDINDLAAVRMENPAVFAEAHRLLFEFLGDGRITGLRIDHPDGLWDPGAYLDELQRGFFLEQCRRELSRERGREPGFAERADLEEWLRLRPLLSQRWERARAGDPRSPVARPLYVVVEKILSRGERLPEDFACDGTVGYEFGALLGALFVDHASEKALTEIYRRATGLDPNFPSLVYQKKKLILQSSLASELNVLAHALNRLSETNRYSRDFTLGTLTQALVEVIAWFPVYRTYVNHREDAISLRDRQFVEKAIRLARRRSPMIDPSVYSFLQAVLSLDLPTGMEEQRGRAREFVMKFQQLTGPVMAKGLEDTAFYVYHRLISLNEVGGEPERFGISPATFHQANEERQRASPHALLATSTHDTKRSEDVRARISVLSEIPATWDESLAALRAAAEPARAVIDGEPAPDDNEEYLFHQTVLGTLPFGPLDGGALADYASRIVAYMSKAMKEAKVNTSWINPNGEHESAVERFVRSVLREGSAYLAALAPLAETVSFHGMWSALSQALLKLTVPGVPDIYQGSELWQLHLVDPDNRRPVDFAARRALLDEVRTRRREGAAFARELVAHAEDGRIKLFVTQVALSARAAFPALFAEGAYRPMTPEGPAAEHVIAFSRALGDQEIIVLAPRFTAKLTGGQRAAPIGSAWRDTCVALPPGGGRHENLFTGAVVDAGGPLQLDRVFGDFPLALLKRA